MMRKGYLSEEEKGGDEVYSAPTSGEQMNMAIAEAKRTFPGLVSALTANDNNCSVLTVKMKFDYGEDKMQNAAG